MFTVTYPHLADAGQVRRLVGDQGLQADSSDDRSGGPLSPQPANRCNTTSYADTLDAAQSEAEKSHPMAIEEVVIAKGYHGSTALVDLARRKVRSYVLDLNSV